MANASVPQSPALQSALQSSAPQSSKAQSSTAQSSTPGADAKTRRVPGDAPSGANPGSPDDVPGAVLIGKCADGWVYLNLPLGNRHGLITGATGSGKTVTLQKLAEGFAQAGVAVFASDVKGDLSGVSQLGEPKPAVLKRDAELGLAFAPDKFTTVYWDVFGQQGQPIRATVSEMGPLLLSRLLELNDTQEGVLNIVFRIADEQKLALVDLKDLRAMLQLVADTAAELTTKYGNVSATSVGAIQRRLLVLEQQGADQFFGEPALDIRDFLLRDPQGRGVMNILAADALLRAPRLYATFLLWMLSELFTTLPEVGDLDKPKLVFFFDEAHLLFDNAPPALMTAIEQVVRLIRSKGVGVYFVTQNPLDVPDIVLAQLGNRIQHALRAFTPRDQKAVRAAAETFRQNPAFSTQEAITQLGVGEALVSVLDLKGSPTMVQRTLVAPPCARIGPITPQERAAVMRASPTAGKYDTPIDRISAFEILQKRAGGESATVDAAGAPQEAGADGGLLSKVGGMVSDALTGGGPGKRKRMTPVEIAINSAVQSAARSAGTQLTRVILRNVLGGIMGKK